jgi:dephospho-CoA kinase
VLKLGLTGGIGAGKSTVSRRLAERGAVVIDADLLAREVVEPGTDGLAEVVDAFGAGVLRPDGGLDRGALGRLVFTDEAARSRLNAILHPRIAALTASRMAAAGGDAIVVHDVPLLVENRMGAAYHLVLVVHAAESERIRRLVADRGMPEADARSRVAAQADDQARRAAADVWLDNSGTPQELVAAVDRVWAERLVPFAENLRLHRPARPARPAPPARAWSGPSRAAVVQRLVARLRRAVGDPDLRVEDDEAAPAGVRLTLLVPDLSTADGLRQRLDDAGFVRVPAADPAERVHAAADPGCPVTVHLRSSRRGTGSAPA